MRSVDRGTARGPRRTPEAHLAELNDVQPDPTEEERDKVDAGDVWRANFHIHTTSATPAEDVSIQYTVTYEPITAQSTFKYTTPYFLDVTGCGSGSVYDVPGGGAPGSEHVATKTYTAPRDGIAVFTGGHIHAGGIDVSLTRDATGEDYCTATATYRPGGHPSHRSSGSGTTSPTACSTVR